MKNNYLDSSIKQFEYYKLLGEKTIISLTDEQLNHKVNDESNSVTSIVKHLHGNMLSRWTDFLTTDGEKTSRKRDEEFEDTNLTREQVLQLWEEGWACLFSALRSLTASDLEKIIYIRNQGHTVMEAINRQLAHYPYHVGQIVYIGKMALNTAWVSLSIPKGNSAQYNAGKFSEEKKRTHFTDETLKTKNDDKHR